MINGATFWLFLASLLKAQSTDFQCLVSIAFNFTTPKIAQKFFALSNKGF